MLSIGEGKGGRSDCLCAPSAETTDVKQHVHKTFPQIIVKEIESALSFYF